MKKKTGHSTKSMWNSIFCWSRFGNKYLLKYYHVLCIVQFYLLPSLPGNPGTSPALQVWEWGIVWSSPVPGGRWVGQIKKISSLWFCEVPVISRVVYTVDADFKTTYFEGKMQEFVREWLGRNNLSKLKSLFKDMF